MDQEQQRIVANRNLSYRLAESIGRRILIGDPAPGEILPGEVELGEMYGVSRTAVREAIKMLAAKGMVLPRPRIGTRVMPKKNWNYLDQDLLAWLDFDADSQLIVEYQKVRLTLEPEAAALAAVHATAEDRLEFEQLMLQMHQMKDNFDQDRWVEIDTRFHQLVYFSSGNHFISPFGNLFKAVFENYFRVVTREQVMQLDVHQRIVDGILNHDSDAARQATLELLQ
ncbi:FCD domain-containing protein [Photobacterium phosphoreum]|jgi:DNA-binding FadR family transcriptional regulator|uniref:FCD domain-containing protein n=2 Tax=Photobacterium phosphoreum TaxID=659 RepID=A0AAW4ZX44_PHOPO|nr:FadR/GntR family transcriptional regulator [Photobacterium phosphoreum]KJF86407.1 GntR family transcriptional regulator [Photobacterium phosphoreum]MCD9465399.1 FadR family transcriptional regulator [Photobacterium phosphoreum]MCD9472330.1 FadR family transcriptional regulator [Photobacterium phosphoreum]MCD9480838.1 FCD domain-containing protein [Photobacterium phosphoreum]MCD9484965.1 FCD domain-containing protein [Photobacterium phosphoreum]